MNEQKIDVLTNMYVSAKRELERAIELSFNSPDVQAEYKQDLEDIKTLYTELFSMFKNA